MTEHTRRGRKRKENKQKKTPSSSQLHVTTTASRGVEEDGKEYYLRSRLEAGERRALCQRGSRLSKNELYYGAFWACLSLRNARGT